MLTSKVSRYFQIKKVFNFFDLKCYSNNKFFIDSSVCFFDFEKSIISLNNTNSCEEIGSLIYCKKSFFAEMHPFLGKIKTKSGYIITRKSCFGLVLKIEVDLHDKKYYFDFKFGENKFFCDDLFSLSLLPDKECISICFDENYTNIVYIISCIVHNYYLDYLIVSRGS